MIKKLKKTFPKHIFSFPIKRKELSQAVAKDKMHTGDLFSRLKQGLNYLKEHPIIFVFGLASYMLFTFTLVEVHVLLPSYVFNFLKMDGNIYASAEIYYSFGAIFSGVLILRFFKKLILLFFTF